MASNKRPRLTHAEMARRIADRVNAQVQKREFLTGDERVRLETAWHQALDVLTRSGAAEERRIAFWQWIEHLCLWQRIAENIAVGNDEMCECLGWAERLIKRYAETGRIGFNAEELAAARQAVGYMSDLAAITNRYQFNAAVDWACVAIEKLAEGVERRRVLEAA